MGARSLVTFTIAGALLAVGALAATGGASHTTPACDMDDPPGEVVPVGTDDQNLVYVNDRGSGAVFFYLETNQIDGLQTGDANPTQDAVGVGYTDGGHQDICGHESDTLVL